MVVAVVVTTAAIAVNGLSFFLFSSAAVAEIMVPAANLLTGVVFTAPSYIILVIKLITILWIK